MCACEEKPLRLYGGIYINPALVERAELDALSLCLYMTSGGAAILKGEEAARFLKENADVNIFEKIFD